MVRRLKEIKPKICVMCGREFTIKDWQKPFRFAKQVCCSRKCNAIYVTKTYCKGKNTQNNIQVERKCINCGNIKLVPPCLKNRPFCNRKCMSEYISKHFIGERSHHWQGGKITRKCLVCGSLFSFDKGELRRRSNSRIYCSMRCNAINRMSKTKKSDTDIEKLLEEWLKQKQIFYEKQKIIENITITDFFIPPNICLYADGDYWHSFPRTQIKDKQQNDALIKLGYIVYRLKGSEIKNGVRPNEILCNNTR